MALRFEWDPAKERLNRKQHRISFWEASSVFADLLSLTIYDPDHSEREARFVDIGRSRKGRLVVVSYTERADRIRIISARLATRTEQRKYEEGQ